MRRHGERQIEAVITDRVDPSPRDHPSKHVLKKNRVSGLDGRLTWFHVEDAEATDPHRTDGVAIAIIISIFFHRTADAPRNLGPRDRAIVTLQSLKDRSDGVEELWKNSTIAVRSSRDRAAIEPRLGSIRGGITAIRVEGNRRTTRTTIVARSWRDHGPIAARLWRNRGPIAARSRPDRGLIVGHFEAEIKADLARN